MAASMSRSELVLHDLDAYERAIAFGVPVAALTSLWDLVWLDAFTWTATFAKLPMWIAAGGVWALWMWHAMEKRWRQHVGRS